VTKEEKNVFQQYFHQIGARRQNNPREREKMIREAISLCKDVAAKLNLDVLVRKFGHFF
jgi:hypothetical protein